MDTKRYTDLKDKTIFDFTNDEELLKRTFPNYTGRNKHEIVAWLLSDQCANGFYLLSYADFIEDPDMTRAIKRQFDMNEINGFDPD